MRLRMRERTVVVFILLGTFLSKFTFSIFASGGVIVNFQSATRWVSSEELLAMARRKVEPVYPAAATAIRIHALVPQVEVKINKEGEVIFARAVSGPSLLRDAAIEAAKSWKFGVIGNCRGRSQYLVLSMRESFIAFQVQPDAAEKAG